MTKNIDKLRDDIFNGAFINKINKKLKLKWEGETY